MMSIEEILKDYQSMKDRINKPGAAAQHLIPDIVAPAHAVCMISRFSDALAEWVDRDREIRETEGGDDWFFNSATAKEVDTALDRMKLNMAKFAAYGHQHGLSRASATVAEQGEAPTEEKDNDEKFVSKDEMKATIAPVVRSMWRIASVAAGAGYEESIDDDAFITTLVYLVQRRAEWLCNKPGTGLELSMFERAKIATIVMDICAFFTPKKEENENKVAQIIRETYHLATSDIARKCIEDLIAELLASEMVVVQELFTTGDPEVYRKKFHERFEQYLATVMKHALNCRYGVTGKMLL